MSSKVTAKKLKKLAKHKPIIIDSTTDVSETETETAITDQPIAAERVSSDNLAKLPILSVEETTFFKLVKKGDLLGVEDFINSGEFNKINVNRTDPTGYTALHYAVRNQDEKLVSLLLNQKDIILYDTVFHAIQEENVEIAKQLTEFYDVRHPVEESIQGWPLQDPIQNRRIYRLLEGVPTAFSQTLVIPKNVESLEPFDSDLPPYITPLAVAAEIGNVELMEYFLTRRPQECLETDQEDHNCGCTCRVCHRSEKTLENASERNYLFGALTNPNYICFITSKTQEDPINYALNKIEKCKELEERDREFSDKYLEYIKNLTQFITDFIGLCETNSEIETFFKVPRKYEEFRMKNKFARLWSLVELNLVPCVVHPNAQHALHQLWVARDWKEWNSFGFFRQIIEFLMRIIFLPFFIIACWAGKDSIGKRLRCPLSRYLNWVAAYMIFLGALVVQVLFPQRCNDKPYNVSLTFKEIDGNCNKRGAPNIGTEWVLVLFVIGFYISLLKRNSIPWFWDSLWSIYDLVTNLIFTITFSFWAWAFFANSPSEPRKIWADHYPEVLGDIFLSFACIFAFGKLFHLIELHRVMGPLQIGLGGMLRKFFSTALVYTIVLISFSTGLNSIFVPYEGLKGVDDKNETKEQSNSYGTRLGSMEELFWAFFGMSGYDKGSLLKFPHKRNGTDTVLHDHELAKMAGLFFYGVFVIIGTNMMFTNMLVVYFVAGSEELLEDKDASWKFARTQIYMTYIKDTVLPPPFNIIPPLEAFSKAVQYLLLLLYKDPKDIDLDTGSKASCSMQQCCFIEIPPDQMDNMKIQRKYKLLIADLRRKYKLHVAERENKSSATSDDVKEISEELTELKSQIHSKLREFQAQLKLFTADNSKKNLNRDDDGTGGGGVISGNAVRKASKELETLRLGNQPPKQVQGLTPPVPPRPKSTEDISKQRKLTPPITTQPLSINTAPAPATNTPNKENAITSSVAPPPPPKTPEKKSIESPPPLPSPIVEFNIKRKTNPINDPHPKETYPGPSKTVPEIKAPKNDMNNDNDKRKSVNKK